MALPPPSSESTCLVTGASSGIGAEIARVLAARGHGVTLTARREERLRELADELASTHGIRAEVEPCDVSDPEARERLVQAIAGRGLAVEVLVNNAGFGSSGRFHRLDAGREVGMVEVNIEAVVALCGALLPQMVDRGQGAVCNVASTAAYQPLPGQATYAASKAFVLSFTEALHAELSGTGVTATALCPGPVRTEFAEEADAADAEERFDFAWMAPEPVARAAVDGLESGARVVVPGLLNRAGTLGGRHIPRGVLLPLVRRVNPFTD